MLLFCFKPLTNNRGVARNFPVVRTLCQIQPYPSHKSFSRFDLITQFHEEISSIRATVIARLFGKIEVKHCIERKNGVHRQMHSFQLSVNYLLFISYALFSVFFLTAATPLNKN